MESDLATSGREHHTSVQCVCRGEEWKTASNVATIIDDELLIIKQGMHGRDVGKTRDLCAP
eukprot:CAMPEP_0194763788 /NCGR_PEP_ID=MMETSP0323_2-20130528/20535_1 /TAXON_ID=2866 ORGANISM="Crypthecodinium cohnii, Strain Seligo" /NCGR_SAMPLE_ID=MMETSP0323_2 /ASSEMBLY_ACC=CAM_ASM_000346 /LENGTH=60 /DNA_ID=CAMNT_0039689487 /DNA_START=103 /DNA_END=281 /DNA_ORIENTATION=-